MEADCYLRSRHSDNRIAPRRTASRCRYDVGANHRPPIERVLGGRPRRARSSPASARRRSGSRASRGVAAVFSFREGRAGQRLWRWKNSHAIAVASISVVIASGTAVPVQARAIRAVPAIAPAMPIICHHWASSWSKREASRTMTAG